MNKKFKVIESKESNGKLKPSQDKAWLKYYSKEVIEAKLPQMTIYDYLYENNKDYQENVALKYFGRKITYEELFKNIDEVARALCGYGIKKGDIVTISMPTTPETIYLFYALSKIGAISNMIDPRTSEEGITEYLNEAESKLFIAVEPIYNKIKNIIQKTKVKNVVTVSPGESLPFGMGLLFETKEFLDKYKDPTKKINLAENDMKWSNFINEYSQYPGYKKADYVPDTPVAIVHTGGTTGTPKGVVLSNDNLNAAAHQCLYSGIDFKREHTWLNFMPPFIAYGIGNGLHLPLAVGMEVTLIPQFDAKKFDKLIKKNKTNHFAGVPSYWGMIIESSLFAKEDLSYLLAPIVGGDAMDIELEKRTNKFLLNHNCPSLIIKGYGMTEVCAAVSVCATNAINEIGSVGIPFAQTIISAFDPETGEELGYNEIGEICITGPNTMLEYFKNEEETKRVKKIHDDGLEWIHSGDCGYVNDKGKVFIVDRIKNMIIRTDGFKVFPLNIEKVISTHPGVFSCKVVGIPVPGYVQGKMPKAHIVLRKEYIEREQEVEKELREMCLDKLPEYSQPDSYKFRENLPLTNIGKVDTIGLANEDIDTDNGVGLKKTR